MDFDPDYKETTNSLLTFGIADFTSFNLKNGIEQEQVRLFDRARHPAVRAAPGAASTVTMEEPDPLRPVLRFQYRRGIARRFGCRASRVIRRDPAAAIRAASPFRERA